MWLLAEGKLANDETGRNTKREFTCDRNLNMILTACIHLVNFKLQIHFIDPEVNSLIYLAEILSQSLNVLNSNSVILYIQYVIDILMVRR